MNAVTKTGITVCSAGSVVNVRLLLATRTDEPPAEAPAATTRAGEPPDESLATTEGLGATVVRVNVTDTAARWSANHDGVGVVVTTVARAEACQRL